MTGANRPVIDVAGVSKQYLLRSTSAERTLIDTIGALGSRLPAILQQRRSPRSHKAREFWALRDISFQVTLGEVVGVIGNNGAGKTTLLKILSRITEPTSGVVTYFGRVGSLLEVGTGFHPELSGRDNIFLNGAILGMRRHDIARHLDEIVAFAGIEGFIDLPVKRYSSGMYLRLAFAVAAHLDTDILLIDEVLAVGDINFQKKCLARMNEIAREGRTILFVSHNLTAIGALCKRTLALREGRLVADGETGRVLKEYLKSALTEIGLGSMRRWNESAAPESAKIRIMSVSISPVGGKPGDAIDVATSFSIEWQYCNCVSGTALNIALLMRDQQGLLLFSVGSWDAPVPLARGQYRSTCTIPGYTLNDGTYLITLEFRENTELLLELPNVLQIEILDSNDGRHGWFGKWEGLLRPRFPWVTEAVNVDADELTVTSDSIARAE